MIDQLTDAAIDTADTLPGLEALPGLVAPEGCSTAGSEDLRALAAWPRTWFPARRPQTHGLRLGRRPPRWLLSGEQYRLNAAHDRSEHGRRQAQACQLVDRFEKHLTHWCVTRGLLDGQLHLDIPDAVFTRLGESSTENVGTRRSGVQRVAAGVQSLTPQTPDHASMMLAPR
jgi:hypothetical protein